MREEVDSRAQATASVVVGAGINPGFLMDLFPAVVSAPFPEPDCIVVERTVDVSTRRTPLQEKVGVSKTPEEFQRVKVAHGIGHRGLEESLHLLGAALGYVWDRVVSDVEPVLADRVFQKESSSLGRAIEPGEVIGMHNFGRAYLEERCRCQLDLTMALGVQAVDRIELRGPTPFPVRIEIPGGVPGDDGTARVLLSILPLLSEVPRGLRTVLDLPGGVRARWGPGTVTSR